VQRSQFTTYRSKRDGLESVKKRSRRGRLEKILVAASKIGEIREELVRCGITETTVFPDPEGVGREVMYEWTSETGSSPEASCRVFGFCRWSP